MNHANDNQPRSPEEHRKLVAEQATAGERAYQGGSWPQGRRLHKAGKLELVTGLVGWQVRNTMPRLSAANDNRTVDFDHTETVERDVLDADTIVAAVEAEKREPGNHYREETQEVYVVTSRDDDGKPVKGEWRAIAGETVFDRQHSSAAPDWAVDDMGEEEKIANAIDTKRIRARLGPAVCTLLDMAAGDSTTGEIADAIGVSRAKAESYVEMAVQKYLQIAA
ncbi:hypothetical protein OCAR_6170 [Afipia carboxidovorans OM5]|uniref:Uncharacterized protein n=1 Tax=Afipia carboxidovorans (strain ATCC 49405 / DSM 1227 / KCTC 32145 / OM5) TaxID=504832 RepID=B6JEL9_AFIC5|nr:hypothetical protein [Afipia carboxidovorans]ACI93284.1 hypothetical protein OCAR_6170 [Afipia carboxidovorans OM5]AEI02996.1 hypothetical protein OCA4_c18590 [Afipia carboxidovorans OM4]AEI06573.1 hypothetical protein OCA5_c18600 [Afipia carboxidovorans OM5]